VVAADRKNAELFGVRRRAATAMGRMMSIGEGREVAAGWFGGGGRK